MGADFRYEELPVFSAFERVIEPGLYTPLPDDWQIGVADVVNSTQALGDGRYKAVNMAGASVVSAVRNALGTMAFPFLFGGDGAILAVPPEGAEAARAAMAATARFVGEELQLTLRVGMISVAAIRSAGHDILIARYAASSEAVYAMFSGGGAAFAEAELKAGRIHIEPAAPGSRPDLTGLSCRWAPLKSRNGIMLSILAAPADGASPDSFREAATQIIHITQQESAAGNPVPPEGPQFSVNPEALRIEASVARSKWEGRPVRFARLIGEMLMAVGLDSTSQSIGRFDPKRYRNWVARNSDFRKYDDALRMTIDCSPQTADRLEAFMAQSEAARVIDYGLHRQDAAIMTCIVPSYMSDDHVHFLDGSGGGYALAASALKAKLALRAGAIAVAAG
jgi:hypothetical protein